MVTLDIAKVTTSTKIDFRLEASVKQLKAVRMCNTLNDSIPDTSFIDLIVNVLSGRKFVVGKMHAEKDVSIVR